MHSPLPQLERLFLADAGLETDMIFNRGQDLPVFSAVTLVRSDEGRRELEDYFRGFLDLARASGTGCLLESATWRASSDWALAINATPDELDRLNTQAVAAMEPLRAEFQDLPVVISGCIGPRGDGYDPGRIMTPKEALTYHRRQAQALAAGKPDMLSAITMTNIPEAIGIARAAEEVSLPVAIAFTVETDGRLPAGDTLKHAIQAVDEATGAYPAYFMINCAHPTHFRDGLEGAGAWTDRIRGIRANASRCSHAELDQATELDIGDPRELGQLYRELRERLPRLTVLGGCCGTDLRHLREIAAACVPVTMRADRKAVLPKVDQLAPAQ